VSGCAARQLTALQLADSSKFVPLWLRQGVHSINCAHEVLPNSGTPHLYIHAPRAQLGRGALTGTGELRAPEAQLGSTQFLSLSALDVSRPLSELPSNLLSFISNIINALFSFEPFHFSTAFLSPR